MNVRGTGPRTLLVGPLGQRPWMPRNELVAHLDDLGHEVRVNGVGGPELVPPLEPLPSRVGVARNSLPWMSVWFARMLWAWRRTTRAALTEAAIDNVVVWDPVLAGLCRLARPAGVEVVWVPSHREAPRFYESVLRAVLAMTADRVVVTTADDAQWVRGAVTYSEWPKPEPSGAPLLDSWVVLASSVPPDDGALARLARDAAFQPAAAVIFDARDDDRAAPALRETLRAASGAAHVWWAADDEWVTWLGGVPARAVDPSRVLAVDQRHLRVLSEGGSLWGVEGADGHDSIPLLTPVKSQDGWTVFAARSHASSPHDESEWASDVFGPRARSAAQRVAAEGVAIDGCPICGSTDRRASVRTHGATTVLQCRECGLRHASAYVPADDVSATTPRDSASALAAVAARHLELLREVDAAPGRLVHVGEDASAFVTLATEGGWDASTVTLDAFLAARPSTTVDAVVFDHALEAAPEPVAVLRHAREYYLQHGGRVVLNTPNARSVSRYAQRSHWRDWRPGDRVSYPDLWTVRQMLQRSGFQTQFLRTDSYPEVRAAGAAYAQLVGLVSERTIRMLPPLATMLDRSRSERPLRGVTTWIDRRGLGRNVVAIGRAI